MPLPNRSLCAALMAAGALLATGQPALAQPYRYVDEDGVTVYSQRPPEGAGTAASQVQIDPGPPPAAFDTARGRLQQQLEGEVDAREVETRAAAEAAQAQAASALKKKNCEAARQNLATIQDLGARMLRQPDGSVAPVSEEERARLIAEAQAQIKANCE